MQLSGCLKMEAIFHEKQEGSLCAQHCLNALLQGSYFTPVDLAILAQRMDDEERLRMAESGVDSEDYRRFIEQPSGNFDDSGYFSVQVISSALEVWNLELVPYSSTEPRALQAQRRPMDMKAYICNYRDHWFTIRRLGHQWFNLNSLLTGPELLSDTHLTMFLAQLQQEGYSIFVVFGSFPECDVDQLLHLVPAVQTTKPRLINNPSKVLGSTNSKDSEEDRELQKALKLSLAQEGSEEELVLPSPGIEDPEDFKNLQKALSLSLQKPVESTAAGQCKSTELQGALRVCLDRTSEDVGAMASRTNGLDTEEELELQKALRLSLQQDEETPNLDDYQLEQAMRMSLECCEPSSPVTDQDEVRRKRLAFLEGRTQVSRQSRDLTSAASTSQSQVNT
uniref:ubiquitinyl hydrolase 1 n=2 Tax=Timema TaxID=61471 RepID=A0A7R9GX02_TIMPO|nr:unnamed protein product [Timema poppensis]